MDGGGGGGLAGGIGGHQQDIAIRAIAAEKRIARASVEVNPARAIVGIQKDVTIGIVTAGGDIASVEVNVNRHDNSPVLPGYCLLLPIGYSGSDREIMRFLISYHYELDHIAIWLPKNEKPPPG
jgi:hypothetical protein